MEFNRFNLRLRYGDSFSYLGRLCEEYDRTNGQNNWHPDPLTGDDHWTYGSIMGQIVHVVQSTGEEVVESVQLGLFYPTTPIYEFFELNQDIVEELFFLNTLALSDPEPSFDRMLERMVRHNGYRRKSA